MKKISFLLFCDQLRGLALVDQRTLSGNDAFKYSLRTSYVEPIYKNNHLLEMVFSLSGSNRISEKNQYAKDSLTGEYTIFDSIYSNNLQNSLYSEQLELNYRWVDEKFDLMIGARAIAQQTYSRTFYGEGSCFGVKILIDIGLGEIERIAICGFLSIGINRTILIFVRQIDDPR